MMPLAIIASFCHVLQRVSSISVLNIHVNEDLGKMPRVSNRRRRRREIPSNGKLLWKTLEVYQKIELDSITGRGLSLTGRTSVKCGSGWFASLVFPVWHLENVRNLTNYQCLLGKSGRARNDGWLEQPGGNTYKEAAWGFVSFCVPFFFFVLSSVIAKKWMNANRSVVGTHNT